MSKLTYLFAAALLVIISYMPQANATGSTTGTATATVASSLSISEVTEMSFGIFGANGTSGTITTSGATTGEIIYFSGATPAVFSINGAPNETVRVNVGNPAEVILRHPNGTDTMVSTLEPEFIQFDIGADSTTQLQVMGTLTVNANQPSGDYEGTYPISIDYVN